MASQRTSTKHDWLRLVSMPLALLCAAIYLFVSAPPPLPDADSSQQGATIHVRELLDMCAEENAAARKLYTQDIVARGAAVGLDYRENWKEPGVDAGPLPALFLRETARAVERGPLRLGLFLGSEYPISAVNRFSGTQAKVFRELLTTRHPQYFFAQDTKRHVAMYPDVALAAACVDCHNEHADTPKRDWKVGDVMGATTFTYPKERVPVSEAVRVLAAFRAGVRSAYEGYLHKARSFRRPPEIGNKWPTHGYYLPTAEVFMDELASQSSKPTVARLLRSVALD